MIPTHADMINELYTFVARLEGKLASITMNVGTTNKKLKQLTNQVHGFIEDILDRFKALHDQVNQVVSQQ